MSAVSDQVSDQLINNQLIDFFIDLFHFFLFVSFVLTLSRSLAHSFSRSLVLFPLSFLSFFLFCSCLFDFYSGNRRWSS